MIRRFNYTERKPLSSEHVAITLHRNPAGLMSFDAVLNLGGTGLPAEAKVFLEAYYMSSYMRFDYGTVGAVNVPADRMLRDIDRGDTAFFRLKVVDFSGVRGRLLAELDGIVADGSGTGSAGRYPLLPVRFCALGDEVWRINFESGDRPVLEINTFEGVEEFVKKNPLFFSLVFPAATREVLKHILVFEEVADDPDGEGNGWQGKWLEFAGQFNPDPRTPPAEDPDGHDRMEWINKAVAEFCSAKKAKALLIEGLTAEKT